MSFKYAVILASTLMLIACDSGDKPVTNFIPQKADYDVAFKRLEFECVHEIERLPSIPPEAGLLYRYGVHLTQLNGPKDFDKAARYYRIAAAFGDYRAATNLQKLLSQGMTTAERPARETINLVEELMAQSIPGAFYDMGHYLELGYGVRQDVEAARYYFRRAADMGNPHAQYYVADMLARIGNVGGVAHSMMRCAMEQGHAKAAADVGTSEEIRNNFTDAALAYQVAVKAGDSASATILAKAFSKDQQIKAPDSFALGVDSERARRYRLITAFIRRYEHLGAKVPDIDQIVPLPPAKLPEWDETFEWKRKRDAAVTPSPPSEELIARMCEEKGLDPATGWPLSGLK